MDRDVYLILIGAGVSLASSIVTLIIQALVDELVFRRRDRERKKEELRRLLLGEISSKHGHFLKQLIPSIKEREFRERGIGESYLDGLLREMNYFGGSGTHIFPSEFIAVFVTVFLGWILFILPKIR